MTDAAPVQTQARRKDRSLDTRESTQRTKGWTRPTALPDPEPSDGFSYRWVRTSMLGQTDNQNVSMKFREGWEAVKADEVKKLGLDYIRPDRNSEFTDCLEVGGLLLCKIPTEVLEQRKAFYEQEAKRQVIAVDEHYMSDNNPAMKKFTEKSTRVTFGQGNAPNVE